MKIVLSGLLICLSAYIALCFFMWLRQDSLVFKPGFCDTAPCYTPRDLNLPFDDINFKSSDGVGLHGWFIPVNKSKRNGAVIFFHGNAGHIGHRLDTISLLHRFGLDVFIFDYRGYGNSEGKPSEEGIYQDVQAAWNYVTGTLGIPAEEIVLHGRSLGAGVMSKLATEQKVAGVIMESTFTSVPDVGAEIYKFLPVRMLSRTHFDNLSRMEKMQSPVLIVHSRQDGLIPFHHGQKLYGAAGDKASFLEIVGGHANGFMESGEVYTTGLYNFLQQIRLVN